MAERVHSGPLPPHVSKYEIMYRFSQLSLADGQSAKRTFTIEGKQSWSDWQPFAPHDFAIPYDHHFRASVKALEDTRGDFLVFTRQYAGGSLWYIVKTRQGWQEWAPLGEPPPTIIAPGQETHYNVGDIAVIEDGEGVLEVFAETDAVTIDRRNQVLNSVPGRIWYKSGMPWP